MAGIFLGANEIKYNAVPVGNMRVGGTNICKGYVGSVLVFDNCAVANSNVELQLDTSGLSGPSAGYNITGNLAGFTKSGQPNSSYTKFTTNIALSSSSYYWVSGPSVIDAPAGTFPSTPGSTVLVTTTITGQVAANIPTYTDNISVVKNSPSTGSVSVSPTAFSGASGTNYTIAVTFTPATGYTYPSLQADDGSSTINLSLNSSSGNYEGTLSRTIGTGTSVTVTITGSQNAVQTPHVFNFTTNLLNATATYNVAGTSGTTSGSAPANNVTVNEPYNTNLTPNLTVTTDPGYTPAGSFTSTNPGIYTFSASNNQTIQVGVTSSPTVVSVSGTATIAYTAVEFYTATGSCANDACINYASGGTTTLYYGSGGPSTGLFTNTGLTSQNTQYAGYHAITTGGALLINPGGSTGALQSCASGSLTQFTGTTFNTTKISACSGPLSDTYYGNSGLLTTSTILYIGNQGCTGVGVGWVSDGNNAVQVSAGGNVIQNQPC